MARMSDEGSLALGLQQRAELEATQHGRAVADAHLDGPTVVAVHGLQAQGERPLLRIDGRWLVTDRPARDLALDTLARPARMLGITQPIHTRTVRRLADPSASQDAAGRAAPALWRVLVGATGSWLPWLLTPAVGWVAWQVAGAAPGTGCSSWPLCSPLGYSWTTLAQDRLAISPAGVRVRSAVFSTLVPWSRVERAVADEDSVVLRVLDPTDAIVVHQHRDLGRFLPGAAGPTDVPRLIEAARPAPTDVRPAAAHLLTPGSAVLLAWVAPPWPERWSPDSPAVPPAQ